jgi:uncharacterized protein YcfL
LEAAVLAPRTFFLSSLVVVLALVTGCSSESEPQTRPTTATVVVAVDETQAQAVVGDSIEIQTKKLTGTTISSADDSLVEVFQGTEVDGVEVNPFVEARAAGTATVTVTRPDGSSYDLVLTITDE